MEPQLPEPTVVGCDVSRITVADQGALEALARLQLAARRLGATIHLRNASPALADLIQLTGLADVLVVDPTDPGPTRPTATAPSTSSQASRWIGRSKSGKRFGSTKKSIAVTTPSEMVSA